MNRRTLIVHGSLTALLLSAAVLFVAATTAPEPTKNAPRATDRSPAAPSFAKDKSLFDRLGGTYPIAAMVDDYIDNLVKDPVVMANPQIKAAVEKAAAAHGVPGLKFQIAAFVIEATGGPYKYHGKPMRDVHKNLFLNQSEWDASTEVFKGTLTRFNVPAREQADIIAVLNTTHDDIVVAPPMEKTRGRDVNK